MVPVIQLLDDFSYFAIPGLETFKKTLDFGQAGDNAGVLVKGVKREDVKRGMVLIKPGTFSQVTRVAAQVCNRRCAFISPHIHFTPRKFSAEDS